MDGYCIRVTQHDVDTLLGTNRVQRYQFKMDKYTYVNEYIKILVLPVYPRCCSASFSRRTLFRLTTTNVDRYTKWIIRIYAYMRGVLLFLTQHCKIWITIYRIRLFQDYVLGDLYLQMHLCETTERVISVSLHNKIRECEDYILDLHSDIVECLCDILICYATQYIDNWALYLVK